MSDTTTTTTRPARGGCRVCGGAVEQFLDLGPQPLSDAFRVPGEPAPEFFFHMDVGACADCSMVQLLEEVPREQMFHQEYPYRSSLSSTMREHFAGNAQHFLDTELTGPDPFMVEIGSNDGVLLETVAEAGVRHLGVDPSGDAAEVARGRGIDVQVSFFEEEVGRGIRERHGPADVIFSANTYSHIAYVPSILRGVNELLTERGIFVFEDPYLGDILEKTSYDQISDEHFYLFSATSVSEMARLHGLELVDVERIAVHGGEVRYTVARAGARTPTPAVAALIAEERECGMHELATLRRFADRVRTSAAELRALLTELREQGKTVVAYGATAKSATVTNFAGIGPDLVDHVVDTTPEKQGRLTPGVHIPVRSPEGFGTDTADYALLFAWNFADEIMAKEQEFHDAGGRWILWTPHVHVV